MKFSRTRLLALLLVAVFSFAAVGATTIASATDATTAAKKKSKKCKKGYKKVGKKCKKKSTKKVSAKVSAVALTITDKSIYKFDFTGTITTKTPLTSLSVKVTATKGHVDIDKVVTATGDGVSNSLTFSGNVANPLSSPQITPFDKKKPITVVAVADGVSSPAVKP